MMSSELPGQALLGGTAAPVVGTVIDAPSAADAFFDTRLFPQQKNNSSATDSFLDYGNLLPPGSRSSAEDLVFS